MCSPKFASVNGFVIERGSLTEIRLFSPSLLQTPSAMQMDPQSTASPAFK